MTYQADCTLPEAELKHVAHQGLGGLPELLGTSNGLERLKQEIRLRTRDVGMFPNLAACLRLVSAVSMEIGDD